MSLQARLPGTSGLRQSRTLRKSKGLLNDYDNSGNGARRSDRLMGKLKANARSRSVSTRFSVVQVDLQAKILECPFWLSAA